MSQLNGFKIFDFNEGAPYASITKNGITFNKSVIIKLGYPAKVQLLMNEDAKQLAVKVCDEAAEGAADFYKENERKILSVRWSGRDLMNTIGEMTGWNFAAESYRVEGKLLRDEKAVLFDLSTATELK